MWRGRICITEWRRRDKHRGVFLESCLFEPRQNFPRRDVTSDVTTRIVKLNFSLRLPPCLPPSSRPPTLFLEERVQELLYIAPGFESLPRVPHRFVSGSGPGTPDAESSEFSLSLSYFQCDYLSSLNPAERAASVLQNCADSSSRGGSPIFAEICLTIVVIMANPWRRTDSATGANPRDALGQINSAVLAIKSTVWRINEWMLSRINWEIEGKLISCAKMCRKLKCVNWIL